MAFLTRKHLPRRTVLRGLGSAVALPLLDAMIPAATALAQTAARPKTAPLLHLHPAWRHHGPVDAADRRQGFRVLADPQALRAVPPEHQRHQQPRPTRTWRRQNGEDTGGAENHSRAAAVFLTGAHPFKGDMARVGVSVDQMAAAAMGQDTPLPLDRDVDRTRRRRLRRQFHLCLSQHAELQERDAAAADGELPAAGVRTPVRRWHHRCAAP